MFLCYKCGLDHCKILSNTTTEKFISLNELQEYKLGQWDREIKRICKERTAADFLMSNHVHHGHISCISIRRGALISRGHHKMASSLSLLLSSPASLIAVCVDIGTFYTTKMVSRILPELRVKAGCSCSTLFASKTITSCKMYCTVHIDCYGHVMMYTASTMATQRYTYDW